MVSWPEREINRPINDDDWDFGPNIKARAQQLIDYIFPGLPGGDAFFRKLMKERGLDVGKYLGE